MKTTRIYIQTMARGDNGLIQWTWIDGKVFKSLFINTPSHPQSANLKVLSTKYFFFLPTLLLRYSPIEMLDYWVILPKSPGLGEAPTPADTNSDIFLNSIDVKVRKLFDISIHSPAQSPTVTEDPRDRNYHDTGPRACSRNGSEPGDREHPWQRLCDSMWEI
jgi:hypothetical protein